MVSREYNDFLNIKWPDFYNENWDIFQENVRKYQRSFNNLIPEIRFDKITISNTNVELTFPGKVKSNDVLLYIHGGGFIMGCPEGVRDIVSFFCNKMGIKGYSPDYRLAPQYAFPAALEDCYNTYIHLLDNHVKSKIYVMGDSAGANLALALVQKLIEEGKKLPCKIVVLSPPTDLTEPNIFDNSELDIITGNLDIKQIMEWYAPGEDLRNPLLSPIYASLDNFPPIYISAGTDEVLFQDSMKLYYEMKKRNIAVNLDIGIGLCHCYPVYLRYFPEAKSACENIIKFLMEEI